MRTRATVLYFSPDDRPIPQTVEAWLNGNDFRVLRHAEEHDIMAVALRSMPMLIVVDADGVGEKGEALCRSLKQDPYTAVIPLVFLSGCHVPEQVHGWFGAGADEVISPLFEPQEQRNRLDVLMLRTHRYVSVHPSTRLPGTTDIEREFRRRMEGGAEFAVCYADLDHFKEYNDRYSYHDGDRVIFILSRILRDVVNGLCAGSGFVGHIGGDDFIMVLPIEDLSTVCREVISTFDLLIPFQYSPQDGKAGYFFGKDRRGHLHRVPLMTLSIGIVTNENRKFEHPAKVSELATEMKSYAKTLPGSVFVVDRRRDSDNGT